MPTCVFLSMDSLGNYVSDDELVGPHLQALGWQVQTLSWHQSHPWEHYDKVVIRSTWDYQKAPLKFLQTLRKIEQSGTPLFNSVSLVEWNLEKSYLDALAQQGLAIVPTVFERAWIKKDFFQVLQTKEIVIKPLISASAQDTLRISQDSFPLYQEQLPSLFAEKAFMVQPFRKAIVEEGEYSLFFFWDRYSHAILKRPKAKDFRVQEEHGGQIQRIDPPGELLNLANRVLKSLPELPLYARLDFVRNPQDRFEIMEVELIEPSMYLRFDKEAPRRFAEAIVAG